jgi:hypothetical protein
MDSLRHAIDAITAKARELRDAFGDDARARTLEWAVAEVEAALAVDADQLLTLAQASALSGYSIDHLARLIRRGRLSNSGRLGAPRVRLRDLPTRPDWTERRQRTLARSNDDAQSTTKRYHPRTDARSLASRRSGAIYDRTDRT